MAYSVETPFLDELPELRRACHGLQRTVYGLRSCDELRRAN